MTPGAWSIVALVGSGTLAGLDLVSVVQGLLSRPLVAGLLAGLILGDVESGLRIGAVLELFALDVVPVGAARYPDFGAATIGAVGYAAGSPWTESLGAAVGLGLLLAMIAGTTIPAVRRLNARVVRAYASRLAAGNSAAVRAVHLSCLAHDLVRSLIVSGVAVGTGLLLRGVRPDAGLGVPLAVVAVAGACWALAHGAIASARTGPRWRWALAGAVVGAGSALL